MNHFLEMKCHNIFILLLIYYALFADTGVYIHHHVSNILYPKHKKWYNKIPKGHTQRLVVQTTTRKGKDAKHTKDILTIVVIRIMGMCVCVLCFSGKDFHVPLYIFNVLKQ